MKFSSPAEVDATVIDKIRPIRNLIEEKINDLISTKNYGSEIVDWGHIVICCKPEMYELGRFKEIKKYIENEKDLDLRLKIDYDAVVKANDNELFYLICTSILRGIDIVENELKIKDFDYHAYRTDLTNLFKQEGWL